MFCAEWTDEMPSEAVTQKVKFQINISPRPIGPDHWICSGKETGIISHGKTRTEAVQRNGELHQMLIRRLKTEGIERLNKFMGDRDIKFELADETPEPEPMTPLAPVSDDVDDAVLYLAAA